MSLFNKILLIIIIFCILVDCKKSKKAKKQEKKEKKAKKIIKEDNIDIIPSALEWAKNNSIYINNKLVLNKKTSGDKHYYFSADSKIDINTLLLRVPYEMMITQNNLNEMYQDSKYKKFEHLWDKIMQFKNEYIKLFSTKQLFYISVILEFAMRKKKGPLYKRYKEYLKLYDGINMDIYPVFYDQQEKDYLSNSNFGSQISRAMDSLNEEYIILDRELNINIPNQDDFIKTRVISMVSSIDLNNSNYEYTKQFNETVIVPFLDCFSKAISDEKANSRVEIKGVKNPANNYTNYYLEIYSNEEIYIGGEINLKWRPFPNAELLLYYGIVEEGNPYFSRYYMDIINKKFRRMLNISENKVFDNAKKTMFEVVTESDSPVVINTYKNLSLYFDKYKNREEGPYEMMLENMKMYADVYNDLLSDGKVNKYINGNEKIQNVKEIMHSEKKLLNEKVQYLEKLIKKIKNKNNGKEDL